MLTLSWCDDTKIKTLFQVCETGLVKEPSLFWLAACPDELVAYQTNDRKLLLEVKCPHTKRHMPPIELVQDPNFYVNLAMGLSGFDTCDFVVYTFKDLIIARTEFDVSYFDSLIQKLISCYKKFMLPRIVSSLTN